ncbi:AI-2E family transporter [Mucilaginibacter ginkgonis]|uniref:AI-2E family transporter n=1 Tax=Mucilaginibacter ginkgonis TaxID=2682091 RepID=A0A6I4HUK6_9SPHI|nr:AI-2E family transporter [Mucilaginibacter ginkgonis]QQL50177.1 AI-2E family transporter [Mucilaginibacter ginkgonis]
MKEIFKDRPFYFRSTITLLGIILFIYVLSVLTDILLPIAFASFLAVLLNPFCNWLQKHKVPRTLSITLGLLLVALVVAGLLYFLSTQIMQFGDTLPVMKEKLLAIVEQMKEWATLKFGIAESKENQMIKDGLNKSQAMLGKTLHGVLSLFAIVVLIPVYIFFMLLYKTLLLNFLYEVFAEENSKQVSEVLVETKNAIQSYIVGLMLETLIVAVLNTGALLILGVKYAILLGCIGALLNLIPYLGGIIAIALPVLISLVTKDGFGTPLAVIIAYMVIQFIDNHVFVPKIVSSKVQINALMSIVVVLLGNQLWGVPGMFLSIPFVAILKIVFDRVEGLKPWGKLLGDNIPTRHMGEIWRNRLRRKVVLDK